MLNALQTHQNKQNYADIEIFIGMDEKRIPRNIFEHVGMPQKSHQLKSYLLKTVNLFGIHIKRQKRQHFKCEMQN